MKSSILAILVLISSTVAFAQNGLTVGENAPDFKAKDQEGKAITLKNALKKGKSSRSVLSWLLVSKLQPGDKKFTRFVAVVNR